MVDSGVILIHDYSTIPGVQDAVDKYLWENPYLSFIELPGSQGLITF
jgi:hypothetical protein